MNKSKLIRWSVPVAVLVLLWVIPTPEGLTPAAWHMFAIFTATIAGILAAPVASGALMFIALAITYFTNTLPLNDVLKGFASGTVWMIFSAYVLSLGFVQSGLGRRIAYRALSLFGGEQQRVAIARALANDPGLIIADEPTGNIDPQLSYEIVELLRKINRQNGTTIIMVTHEHDLVKYFGDLVQFNKTDLLKFRNFGKKSLTELDDLLESLNLSFGTDISKYKLDKE